MAAITYRAGSGREDKAEYRLAGASVPASVITRLLKTVENKSGVALDRAFYPGLAKYVPFLEAMEKAGLTPDQAVKAFTSLKPVKVLKGKARIDREAEGVAKILARKYANLAPEAMLDKFLQTTTRPEFKKEVVRILTNYETKFKRNPMGRIKTSKRMGNHKAVNALKLFRNGKNNTK